MHVTCSLCRSETKPEFVTQVPIRRYWYCEACDFTFLDPSERLSSEDEANFYRLHDNRLEDSGYREFIRPLCAAVGDRVHHQAEGLDFGSGAVPIFGSVLAEIRPDVRVACFDPVFAPDAALLDPVSVGQGYDFIAMSEVAEHLFDVREEFLRLRSLLNENGMLFIQTSLRTDAIDFSSWYYRRDPTHVSFLSARSLASVATVCGFHPPEILGSKHAVLKAR